MYCLNYFAFSRQLFIFFLNAWFMKSKYKVLKTHK
jgi:hypothetical protein